MDEEFPSPLGTAAYRDLLLLTLPCLVSHLLSRENLSELTFLAPYFLVACRSELSQSHAALSKHFSCFFSSTSASYPRLVAFTHTNLFPVSCR